MILLAAIYSGSEYGGRISSILLNVPGDAGAVDDRIGRQSAGAAGPVPARR